jgi:hypothetical protein
LAYKKISPSFRSFLSDVRKYFKAREIDDDKQVSNPDGMVEEGKVFFIYLCKVLRLYVIPCALAIFSSWSIFLSSRFLYSSLYSFKDRFSFSSRILSRYHSKFSKFGIYLEEYNF